MVITIDVREFEAHPGRYVRRAREGETITVTEGGEPVAELGPVSEGTAHDTEHARNQRAPEGVIDGSGRKWDDLPPPMPLKPGERPLSAVLQEMRDEDPR